MVWRRTVNKELAPSFFQGSYTAGGQRYSGGINDTFNIKMLVYILLNEAFNNKYYFKMLMLSGFGLKIGDN